MTDQYVADGGLNRDQSAQRQPFTYEIGEDELPSEAVVRAIAEVTETTVLELDPLYDVIDPTHLDGTLVDTASTVSTELSFQFNGYDVTVTSNEVQVCVNEE